MSRRHARMERAARASLWSISLGFLLMLADGAGDLALAADKARETFVEMCSICHGVGGKGDGPSAAGLNPRPADFTNCAVMQKQSDATLFTIIKRGGQGAGRSTVMPAWGDALPDGQIQELVGLVRGFCKR
jgi:mono/diheme cytochrome c family protein